jgi:hypothetical protein
MIISGASRLTQLHLQFLLAVELFVFISQLVKFARVDSSFDGVIEDCKI